MASYSWFTVKTTAWRLVATIVVSSTCAYIEGCISRTSFRRDANKADNKAASAAVDSLINFEAVKVRLSLCRSWEEATLTTIQHFNNEKHEIAQYDKHLAAYEKASIKVTTSLAYLNSGQNVIFSSALTAAMFLAAQGIVNGL